MAQKRWLLLVLGLLLVQPGCDSVDDDDTVDDDDDDTVDDDDDDASDDDDATSATYIRVDDAPAGAGPAGTDIVIDDDGTIYVSWVDERNGGADLWLSTSSDQGLSWSPSVQINGAEQLVAAGWSYPRLTLGTNDIAWVGTTGGPRVVARQGDKATLSFGAPLFPGLDLGLAISEIGHGQLTEDDELWVAWLDMSEFFQTELRVGNPTVGYEDGAIRINTGLGNGVTCGCCPIELQWRSDNSPMVAWRDNLDNVRNMGFATGTPNYGAFGPPVNATSIDWEIAGCPTQGPRLVELADESLRILWTDSPNGAVNTYIAASHDEGASWEPATIIEPAGTLGVSPIATVGDSGRLFVSMKTSGLGIGAHDLTWSDDDGETFVTPIQLTATSSSGRLTFVELASGNGVVGLAGIGLEDGGIYFRQLE